MRWKTSKVGDERERAVFAWLPIQCTNGETAWLEKVSVQEIAEHQTDGVSHWISWVITHAEVVP